MLVERGGSPSVRVGAPDDFRHRHRVAHELKEQGRLGVTAADFASLTKERIFRAAAKRPSSVSSVRELSAPDSAARVRACERLRPASPSRSAGAGSCAPSRDHPVVQVALLCALACWPRPRPYPW